MRASLAPILLLFSFRYNSHLYAYYDAHAISYEAVLRLTVLIHTIMGYGIWGLKGCMYTCCTLGVAYKSGMAYGIFPTASLLAVLRG